MRRTNQNISEQTKITYLDYKKINKFNDVGFFLQNYVNTGGEVTKNVQRNDMIDVTTISAALNNHTQYREGTSFLTTIPNTTYYLDFHQDGDWWWGTGHPVGASYLTVAEVTTDENGNVDTITDKAEPRGGFRLKSEFGLEDYARKLEVEDISNSVGTSVESFGAVGDGEADDTEAIEHALKSGKPIIGDPQKKYRITRTITVDNCNIVGNLNLVPSGAFLAIDVGSNKIEAQTKLAGNVTPRETQINVEDASGIKVGQIIQMVSDALWYYDNRGYLTKGELHLVKAVNGNTVEVSEPIWDEYYINSETVTIRTFAPNTCYINGLNISYSSPTNTSGMRIKNLINPVVTNLKIKWATVLGLSVSGCYGATINAPSIIECFTPSSETGYGIQDSSSFGTVINAGYFYRNRRGVDFSGNFPSRGWIVSNSRSICWSQDVGDGLGTHGTAEFGMFLGNQTFGGIVGFNIRGGNIKCIGNQIWGPRISAIAHSSGDSVEILDNTYYGALNNRSFVPTLGAPTFYSKTFSSSNARGVNIVKGNIAHGLRMRFIMLDHSESNLIVQDNEIHGHSNGSAFEVNVVDGLPGITISRSKFNNNTFFVTNGRRKYFSDNLTIDPSVDFDEMDIGNNNLSTWIGSGTLSNVEVDIRTSKTEGIVRLVGRIKFDVSGGGVGIILNSLPRAENVFYSTCFREDNKSEVVITNFSIATNPLQNLYISSNSDDYNGTYPPGTGYIVHVDISYRCSKSLSLF